MADQSRREFLRNISTLLGAGGLVLLGARGLFPTVSYAADKQSFNFSLFRYHLRAVRGTRKIRTRSRLISSVFGSSCHSVSG